MTPRCLGWAMSEREIQSPMSGRNDSGQTKQPQTRAAGWRWQGMLQRVERHQSFRCDLRIMSGHSRCHKQTLLCSGKQPANSTSRFYYPPVTPVTQQFCNISLTPVHEAGKHQFSVMSDMSPRSTKLLRRMSRLPLRYDTNSVCYSWRNLFRRSPPLPWFLWAPQSFWVAVSRPSTDPTGLQPDTGSNM